MLIGVINHIKWVINPYQRLLTLYHTKGPFWCPQGHLGPKCVHLCKEGPPRARWAQIEVERALL